ncbi:protein lava lamp isoform X3 [Folsomia candida]|uniref:Protein lava lamp n=1 Tax=Folsomia candida TaxID=158441 RepID=A0A226CX94_FOLCA|nr:protein lava lamp isoform X3 [Folsomia candida]OXA37244.1 Protein lava lamp [Folsomia candida]
MDRDDLQEIPSSDDDDDATELRGRLQKLTARGGGINSPEFTSPIGSPPGEDSVLSAKGRFMEMKRMMQEDKKRRKSKRKSKVATEKDPDVEGFEEIGGDPEEWEGGEEGSISPASYTDDVEQLLQSFRSERAGDRDLSLVTHRLENHPRMMEVCQQLRERDQNILRLEGKVLELDRQVIDLQDTLSEKEKLLNSKNDAVNCMVAKYQQSIADRDTELSKTQQTLFELEKKFGTAQNNWKTEKDRLNAEIKQQNQRLKDLDDTNKLLQASRVEQTSRDIELEEKLSVLKEDRDRLTQENVAIQAHLDQVVGEKGTLEQTLSEKTDELNKTINELHIQIETSVSKTKEDYEAKLTKIKKQFALKLKSVKETAADAAESSTVQDLRTQLNESLEKLNQQAQQAEIFLTEKSTLENEIDHLKSELAEKSTLENEIDLLKSELLEKSNIIIPPLPLPEDNTEEIAQLLQQISTLNSRIIEVESGKESAVSLLGEELSQLKTEKSTAEKDFNERLAEYEQNFERTMDDYEKRLENQDKLEKDVEELKTALEKSKEQLSKMKKQFQAKLKAARESTHPSGEGIGNVDSELQAKYNALEQRNIELEEEKGNNLWIQEELAQLKQEKESLQNEHDSAIATYQNQIEELKSCLDKAADQINQFEQKQSHQQQQQSPDSGHVNFFTSMMESSSGDGVGSWESQTRITDLEHQVATLEEEKGSGFLVEEDVGRLKQEREQLEAEFQEKSAAYEVKITQLEEQLTKSTEQLAKMKRQFQIKLKSLRDENAKASSTSSSPCPPEIDVKLFEEKITSLENKVAELEEEKGNLLLQILQMEDSMPGSDEQQAQRATAVMQESTPASAEDTIRLEIELSQREEEVRQLNDQLREFTSALSQKNVEVEQLMKTCSELEQSLQQNIEELSTSISTKDDEINSQITAKDVQLAASVATLAEKEVHIEELRRKLTDTESRFEEMKALVQEYQSMVDGVRNHDQEELTSLKEELESIREKASCAEQSYEVMKASYISDSNQRHDTITQLEQDLSTLRTDYNEKTVSYDKLKAKYDKKESEFVTQIETLSAQLASYETEIETLRSNMEGNMQTVDLQNSSAAAELEEREKQFKLMEQQLMEDISAKNQQIQALNLELENSKLEADPIREENETFKKQLGEYAAYAESLKNELDSFRGHYSNMESNYNQMYADLTQKSAQLEQLSHSETEASTLTASLRAQVSEGEEKLVQINTTLSILEQDKASLILQVEQLTQDGDALRAKLTGMTNEYIQLRESLESKDTEAQRLRQDADTLQSEYSHSSNELKLKISSLMDQLNDCENEISVVSTRLKESDDICVETRAKLAETVASLEEKSKILEDKSKTLETVENTLFEKTEDTLRLEEKLKETEEKHRLEMEANFVKYSDDVDATYDQLALVASENLTLQEQLRKKEEELKDVRQHQVDLSSSSNLKHELTNCRERISNLEAELNLTSQQFEELQAYTAQQSTRVEELLKEVDDKKDRLTQLSVELEELKTIQHQQVSQQWSAVQQQVQQSPPVQSTQSLWGPPQNDEDPFATILSSLPPPQSGVAPSSSSTTTTTTAQTETDAAVTAELLLESQVNQVRIKELETQVIELAAELEEVRNLQRSDDQQRNMWGPPPPPYQQERDAQDPFGADVPPYPEEPPRRVDTVAVTTTTDGLSQEAHDEQLRQRDQRIYDLEVQLAELQISIDDANLQLGEVTELKTSLEVLTYKIKELEDENSKLRQELQQERAKPPKEIFIPPTPSTSTPHQQQGQGLVAVEEPLIVPSTAYVTTPEQQSAPPSADLLENASKEIKELKVKNGKMIQRFKQLKDKYDAVVKENEGFKTKKEFSLDSAFEDEFFSQVKAKDDLLEEKGKQLVELQTENKRLTEKIDLLERGTERLTEMKEEQDRAVQSLSGSKRALETEVSALKWKMEELENLSLSRVADPSSFVEGGAGSVSHDGQDVDSRSGELQNQGYFDLGATNPDVQENFTLRQQNLVLSQEIQVLQQEIAVQKKSADDLAERNEQLEDELEKMQELQIDQRMRTPTPNMQQKQQHLQQEQQQTLPIFPPQGDYVDSATLQIPPPQLSPNNQHATIDTQITSLQSLLQSEQQEKIVLERKIELLQSKISEIEISEIKCFEESLMLKGWTRQLELDNLKIQREMERIYGSIQDGDTGNIKAKVLQDEIIRLVDTLHDRDKRCEQLTVEITRLLEERDTLQLKLSNALRHNVSLHEEVYKGKDASLPHDDIPSYNKEELQLKLAELEQMNYSMGIDLRREREARRLVQEQLFFSSSSRIYPGSGGRQQQSSPSPSRSPRPLPTTPPPLPSPTQMSHSSIPPPPSAATIQFASPHSPYPESPSMTSTPGYDVTTQFQQYPQDPANYPLFPPPVDVIQPPTMQVQSGVLPPQVPQNEGPSLNVPPPPTTQHLFNI